ncbi:hypothetical protein RHGRI_004602 [Rhododendron griersonianum]|uniref:Non-reducing end beta-L-arabinofuranosidase-like GH127 catalytic domain-containing protein n=1 Tax=Rhododendron griersonianum TaxID=479676 RepID=A0AAV6LBB5_9ERIC|nr:hypothetical protein RHGRI_004602 [Rhododendron griersonianum]
MASFQSAEGVNSNLQFCNKFDTCFCSEIKTLTASYCNCVQGDSKHLLLAHLFDKPCFLGLPAIKGDDVSDFHANSHIPIVIGSQMRYEVTGDSLYKEIGTSFMDVNSSHSYATGGTSVSEFWSDPKRLASTLATENEESCTTYNMLMVTRELVARRVEAFT